MEAADGIIRRRRRASGLAVAVLALLASTAAPAAAAPPASEGWLDDLAAARERATREGKPILVDLWADWCTWCKRLDEEVFSTPVFREYAAGFVLLRVDTEDGGQGTRMMEDFEVASLPTTLLLTADLVKIGELAGFAPAERYVQSLQLEGAMYATLLRAYEDRARGGGEGDVTRTLADELHARRDGERAAVLYRELLERSGADPEEEAWNRYYLADSLRLAGRSEEARGAIGAAREAAVAVDDAALLERVDLLPYLLARDTEGCAQAAPALDRYLELHPEGVFAATAEAAKRRFESTGRCR